jgi:hypothetical protein
MVITASTWRFWLALKPHVARLVTLDADLQNPPEEIGALVDKMREGYDYVGSIRRKRQDSAWRTYASKAMNRLRENHPHQNHRSGQYAALPMS